MSRWLPCSSATLVLFAALVGCERSGDDAQRRRTEPAPVQFGRSLYQAEALELAVAALSQRAGRPVNALRLVVEPHRMVLQAQDPVHPLRVRQFEYRSGSVSGPVPVRLEGEGQLEDNLFPLEGVKLAAFPDMVQRAARHIDARNGKAKRVIVRRDLPRSTEIRVRVYVASPLLDGHVDANAEGHLLGVSDSG
jgi:hypothetical protein